MNKKCLARNLAQSLILGTWTREGLTETLRRRLPVPLQDRAETIASEIAEGTRHSYAPDLKTATDALLGTEGLAHILTYCTHRDIWPNPDLSSPRMRPVAAFSDLVLPQLPTLESLADWLAIEPGQLASLADPTSRFETHGDMAVNHYHYALTPKKSGAVRLIEAPKANLKAIQRQILRGILEKIPTHPDAFGFIKDRNCLMAAQRHASEEVVVCFDLKSFFPSIKAARVFGLFRCLGYPHAVSSNLSALCTNATPPRIRQRLAFEDRQLYRAAHLPQGAPTSPALANQLSFALDRRLAGLAARLNANFTRYADDLSFSGERHIVSPLVKAVPQIIRDEGFGVNAHKSRILPSTKRQMITGVVVNDHVNVPRHTFDRLKAMIHTCRLPSDGRLADPAFRASLLGKIAWVEQVNQHKGQKLRRLLETSWNSAQGR